MARNSLNGTSNLSGIPDRQLIAAVCMEFLLHQDFDGRRVRQNPPMMKF